MCRLVHVHAILAHCRGWPPGAAACASPAAAGRGGGSHTRPGQQVVPTAPAGCWIGQDRPHPPVPQLRPGLGCVCRVSWQGKPSASIDCAADGRQLLLHVPTCRALLAAASWWPSCSAWPTSRGRVERWGNSARRKGRAAGQAGQARCAQRLVSGSVGRPRARAAAVLPLTAHFASHLPWGCSESYLVKSPLVNACAYAAVAGWDKTSTRTSPTFQGRWRWAGRGLAGWVSAAYAWHGVPRSVGHALSPQSTLVRAGVPRLGERPHPWPHCHVGRVRADCNRLPVEDTAGRLRLCSALSMSMLCCTSASHLGAAAPGATCSAAAIPPCRSEHF